MDAVALVVVGFVVAVVVLTIPVVVELVIKAQPASELIARAEMRAMLHREGLPDSTLVELDDE